MTPDSTQKSVVQSSENEPDYGAVDVPSEKPRSEYSYVERRAEILELIQEAGHPRALSQQQLADRYSVSQQQVSKDVSRLGDHIREAIGDRSRRALMVDATVNRAIRGMLEEEEYRNAARTAMEYCEFCQEHHDFDALEAKVEQLREEVAAQQDGDGGVLRT